MTEQLVQKRRRFDMGFKEVKVEELPFNPFTKIGSEWMLITAGYLAWSFITMKWAITWIIWPIAGVLFGALVPIVNLIRKSTK